MSLPIIAEEPPVSRQEESAGADPGEIIKACDIKSMVGERNLSLERHLFAFHYLQDNHINTGHLAYNNCQGFTMANDERLIRPRIDREFWQKLHEQSGLASYMSAERRAELKKQFYQDENIPEFITENINTTFGELIKNAPNEYEEAVCSVFSALSWDYKTNNPVLFGKRIIETLAVSTGHNNQPQTHYNGRWDRINDLVRVMRIMDKKPVHEYRDEIRSKAGSMEWSKWLELPDYFVDLKPFKNGNVHIRFRRPDLVTKMNKIIASRYPHALPPPVACN